MEKVLFEFGELLTLIQEILQKNFPDVLIFGEDIQILPKKRGFEILNEEGKPIFSIPFNLQ